SNSRPGRRDRDMGGRRKEDASGYHIAAPQGRCASRHGYGGGRLIPETTGSAAMLDGWVERNRDGLILLARILLMVLFVVSGWGKLSDFQGTVGYMASLHAPLPQVAAGVAVCMEFLVGIALLLGIQ